MRLHKYIFFADFNLKPYIYREKKSINELIDFKSYVGRNYITAKKKIENDMGD